MPLMKPRVEGKASFVREYVDCGKLSLKSAFTRWGHLGVRHESTHLFGRAADTDIVAIFGRIGYSRGIEPCFTGNFENCAGGEWESWPHKEKS